MKNLFFTVFLLISACSINNYGIHSDSKPVRRLQIKILKIFDGDTILVETQNDLPVKFGSSPEINPHTTNSVRFLFIDSLESSENARLNRMIIKFKRKGVYLKKETIIELGKMATLHLKGIIHSDDSAEIEFPLRIIKDKYERFLGIVFINETNLNYMQVRDGVATVYFLNEENSEAVMYYKKMFIRAEESARSGKLGIWKDLSE